MHAGLRRSSILGAGLVALGACGASGADPDPGTSAILRVAGAQFVPGPPPDGADGGPKVHTLSADTNRVYPGLRSSSFSGTVDAGAQAVLITWQQDTGSWNVPTGVIDALEPTQRTFSATIAFARETPAGRHDVEVRPVDDDGRVGLPYKFTYVVAATARPGALVISLTWDNDSDLDLHVTMPNPDPARAREEPTIEIWPKRPSSFRMAAGMAAGPDALTTAAVLDVDSNSQCVIDGRREENVAIMESPRSGHYVARVDTFALCGQAASRWRVTVYRDGEPRAEAIGVASPSDGYPAQGTGIMFGQDLRPGTAGAGQTALEFDL
jgi:hypothetical protein